MRNTRKQKHELCKNYHEFGQCSFGDSCWFAHEEHELRARALPCNYKTVLCLAYIRTGECKYGDRCYFIHRKTDDTTIWRHHCNNNAQKPSGRLRVFERLSQGRAICA